MPGRVGHRMRLSGPTLLLICALMPALVSGLLAPLMVPHLPGLRALTLLCGYAVSFALLAWWEYKFAGRERAEAETGRDEPPATKTRRAQGKRRPMLAGLVLLLATGTAIWRIRDMEASEAAVIGLVGILSAGYYLRVRATTGR